MPTLPALHIMLRLNERNIIIDSNKPKYSQARSENCLPSRDYSVSPPDVNSLPDAILGLELLLTKYPSYYCSSTTTINSIEYS